MAGLQSDTAIDAGTSEMLQGRASLWDRKSGKLLLVGWLFATAVAWCFLRSHYDNWGKDGVGDTAVPVGLRAVVALALLAPVTLLIGKDSRLAWLTGLSVSLGTLPSLPLFPFLRDYTHLVILVWLFASWRTLWLRISLQRIPLFVFIFIGYTAVCAISAVVNFAIFHNTWQIKVGAAYLILFGAFAAMLYVLAAEPDKAEARLDNLLDGFIWGVGGQVVVALVAVPLIFVIPYSEGNDTIFGLSYYDRYKSTFSGPVAASMFFVLSVPFLLLWAYRLKMNLFAAFRLRMSSLSYWFTLAYLQLMPWFVMATGSRTARVAFVGTFLALLSVRRTRGLMLAMLPSTAVAYFVAFYYQSLPSAVDRFLSANADPNMSLSDRFFAMPERAQLANETLGVMTSASNWLKLVGFGPGTGGYRLSGFPEPHNFFMNQWAETGAVGIFALVAFFVALIWGLIRHALPQREQSFQSVLLLVALMSFAGVSLTYNPSYWGGAMELVMILSTAVVAFDQRARVPNNLDRGSAEVTWVGARTIRIGEPKRSTV